MNRSCILLNIIQCIVKGVFMFEVVKNGPNRIDIDFGGKLDSYEMKAALDELFNNAKILSTVECYIALETSIFQH